MKIATGDWFARRAGRRRHLAALGAVRRSLRALQHLVRTRPRPTRCSSTPVSASRACTQPARDLFEQPTLALATHYHFDHTGSLHEFTERLAHKAGVPYLATPGAIGGALRRAAFSPVALDLYVAAGYEIPDDLLAALPDAGFDPDAYEVTPCPPTRVLDDGDVIDLGDRAFEVLHLPGHSPDSIGLWDAESATLFSGDAVYDGPLLDGNDDSDVEAYVATMERLRVLPVEVVHGGHEPSFGRERLVELCDGYITPRQFSIGEPIHRGNLTAVAVKPLIRTVGS